MASRSTRHDSEKHRPSRRDHEDRRSSRRDREERRPSRDDIRRRPERFDEDDDRDDVVGESLEERTRHVDPDDLQLGGAPFWIVVAALVALSLGIFISTFLVYELRGCQFAAIGVMVMAAAMGLAFHLSRENDEEVHVVVSIVILPYWIVFGLMNRDRYFAPLIISLFAALIFFVGLALQKPLSHWGRQSPRGTVVVNNRPNDPQPFIPPNHNPGFGDPMPFPDPGPNPNPNPNPNPMGRQPVPGDALIGHYGFDRVDPATGAVADLSSRNNHGKSHMPAALPGVKGAALGFNGDRGRYFDYGQSPDFNVEANWDFTITGWLNTRAASGPILCQSNPAQLGGQKGFIKVELVGGQLSAGILEDQSGNVLTATGGVANTGTWQHFALVRRTGEYTLYHNGQPVAVQTGRNGSITTTYRNIGINQTGLELGQGADLNVFQGGIDEVRIYQRALPAQDVLKLSQNP